MNKFTKDTIFIRNTENFLSTEVDGEAVIMNNKNGRYLGLNTVSTDIWNLLSEQKNFETILQTLISEYNIGKKKCEKETRDLLNIMLKLNIIQLKEKK